MARNPTVLALPPFYGVVKRIILTAVVVFFVLLLLAMFPAAGDMRVELVHRTLLHPEMVFGLYVWELLTYPFVGMGLLSLLFAALSFWFSGHGWRTSVARFGWGSTSLLRPSAAACWRAF